MATDFSSLATDIVSALRTEVVGGFGAISKFAKSQSEDLAAFGIMIADSRASGSLRTNDKLFNSLVKRLKTMTENFARAVALQVLVTLEKAWNAIVGVLWGAINKTLGAAAGIPLLPIPSAPKP